MPDRLPVFDIRNGPDAVPLDTANERREAWRRLYEPCQTARSVMNVWRATAIAQFDGHHWIENDPQVVDTSSGRVSLRLHKADYRPTADNIRATLNRTRDITEEITSMLRVEPAGWEAVFDIEQPPGPGSSDEQAICRAAYRDWLHDDTVNLPGAYAQANSWRSQTGSGLLKVVLDSRNPFGVNVKHITADRISWDLANRDPDPWMHREWADTVAYPVEDVERMFGIQFPDKTKKALPTLSELQPFDDVVRKIQALDPQARTGSQSRGVLVTEYYSDWWQRLTIFVHTGSSAEACRVVWDGPNWFHACPYGKYDLGESLMTPWGVGVPHRIYHEQRTTTLAITLVLKHLQAISAVRPIVAAGSVEGDLSEVFSPKVAAPIVWDAGRDGRNPAPSYIRPPDMPAIAWNLVSAMPEVMKDKSHLRDVLMGITSPRGESGDAIRQKLAQSGRVFADLNEKDLAVSRRFLTALGRYLVNFGNRAGAVQRACRNIRGQWDAAVQRQAVRGDQVLCTHRVFVSVPREATQPKTPDEMVRDWKEMVSLQIMSPDEMRLAMVQQLGRSLTKAEGEAVDAACHENDMFMAGAQAYVRGRENDLDPERPVIKAVYGEAHDIHDRIHGELVRRRYSMPVPDDVVKEVTIHRFYVHREFAGNEALQQAAIQAEAQMLQPGISEALGAQTMGPSIAGHSGAPAQTPVGGGLAAPSATPADYQARERDRVQQAQVQAG